MKEPTLIKQYKDGYNTIKVWETVGYFGERFYYQTIHL